MRQRAVYGASVGECRLAEVLRVYGTGSLDDARRHHASIAHLG